MSIHDKTVHINREMQRKFAYILQNALKELPEPLTEAQEEDFLNLVADGLEPHTSSVRGFLKFLKFEVDEEE